MFRLFQNSSRNRRRDAGYRLFAETGEGALVPRTRRPWWFKPLLSMALLATLWFGGNLVWQTARDRWLNQIDALALRQLIVTRDGVLTEEEIRRLAGVQPGRNVLTIDLYVLRQRLLRHPRIEEATVRLEFPDTLRIGVRERVPVARVLLPSAGDVQGYFLLDDTGHVLIPFERGHAPVEIVEAEAALPLLNGMTAVTFSAGQTVMDQRVLAALKLIAGFDASAMAGVTELLSVDIASPGVLVVLSNQGARVTLAGEDFDRQLREWRAVHEQAIARGHAIGTLDLSVRGNAPLKWIEASAAPASAPDPIPKTVRPNRKPTRHV